MGRRGAWVAALALAGAVLTGCGSEEVRIDDQSVTNSEEILQEADGMFDDLVSDGVDQGTSTVSEESRCYFQRDDDDNVGTSLFCGPIRQIGLDNADAWIPIETEVMSDSDGRAIQIVSMDGAVPGPVDAAELFRPDGNEPVDSSTLDEPKAPESPVDTFAALLPRDEAVVEADFDAFDSPFVLATPAAMFTVTATAELDVISREVVASVEGRNDSDDVTDDVNDDSMTSYYRPAEGHVVRAWEITVGPPPLLAPEARGGLFGSGHENARDATTALAVAAGSQRLMISGNLDEDTDGKTAAVSCEAVQCSDRGQERMVLVADADVDEPFGLIATVDGVDQTLDLSTGEVASDVSTVAHEREATSQQVSTAWGSRTVVVQTEDQLEADGELLSFEDLTYEFGGEVQRAYLSPFDYARGWAPSGQAWLVIPVLNDPQQLSSGNVSIDWAKTWTLTVGDRALPHEHGAGPDHSAVFLVNDTFTTGTFTYSPAGSVETIGGRTHQLATDEPFTIDISFP